MFEPSGTFPAEPDGFGALLDDLDWVAAYARDPAVGLAARDAARRLRGGHADQLTPILGNRGSTSDLVAGTVTPQRPEPRARFDRTVHLAALFIKSGAQVEFFMGRGQRPERGLPAVQGPH